MVERVNEAEAIDSVKKSTIGHGFMHLLHGDGTLRLIYLQDEEQLLIKDFLFKININSIIFLAQIESASRILICK